MNVIRPCFSARHSHLSSIADTVASGGRRCGNIHYVINGAPVQVVVCHRPDCQRFTGAQSVAWLIVPLASFSVTHGGYA